MRTPPANPLEKSVQVRVIRIYEAFGCAVAVFSQARATHQTPGIPDLYVLRDGKGGWWHETKRPRGWRQSKAQRDFQARCQAAGVTYVLGGTEEAYAQLRALGLISTGIR